MQTLEHLPQAAITADETLRLIERRLDSLSELFEAEQHAARIQPLSLASYRRSVAKDVDQAMAQTQQWWQSPTA